MTTETYWIVRNDAGEHLAGWWDASETGAAVRGFVFDTPKHTKAHEATTRAEAEALAAEHGGHVVEVTVTERRVGELRWEDSAVLGDTSNLYEGDRLIGWVGPAACVGGSWAATRSPWNNDGAATHWSFYSCPYGRHLQWPISASLDAAKAAAEAAVRATWGGGAA